MVMDDMMVIYYCATNNSSLELCMVIWYDVKVITLFYFIHVYKLYIIINDPK